MVTVTVAVMVTVRVAVTVMVKDSVSVAVPGDPNPCRMTWAESGLPWLAGEAEHGPGRPAAKRQV